MANGEDWSHEEVEAAVSAYRGMLLQELEGIPFNKAENNRAVQAQTRRNKGSVEFKHQNISAILNQLGLPYIEGYKPRGNYQALLERVVLDVIVTDIEINRIAQQVAEREDFISIASENLTSIWVPAPKPEETIYSSLREVREAPAPQRGKNYAEIEAKNQRLGLAGEQLVLEFEHQRLWQAGQRALAERIDHVSKTKGDGLGYDILSFEEDGVERLIEVKTTQFGMMTPFFVSRNEVDVSLSEADRYHLYRLFSFGRQTRLFALPGAMNQTCQLTPVNFLGRPR